MDGIFADVICASDNQYVYKGNIYRIPETKIDFATAKAYCEEEEGVLAKISPEMITGDFYTPFS